MQYRRRRLEGAWTRWDIALDLRKFNGWICLPALYGRASEEGSHRKGTRPNGEASQEREIFFIQCRKRETADKALRRIRVVRMCVVQRVLIDNLLALRLKREGNKQKSTAISA